MAKITNAMKYKTIEERVKAFGEFCKNEFCNKCNHTDCRLYKQGSAILHCYDGWLAFEAEDEKPEPCVYCKSEMTPLRVGDTFRVYCRTCGYQSSGSYETLDAAIAAHNRVCRAVKAFPMLEKMKLELLQYRAQEE